MILRIRHGVLTNILIGIGGSWIGSELADMAHVAVHGNRSTISSPRWSVRWALLYIWQWINKRGLSGRRIRPPAPEQS